MLVQRPRTGRAHYAPIQWCLRQNHIAEAATGQYRHLSLEEREDIMVSRSHCKSIGEIAGRIGRSKSTVPAPRASSAC